MNVQWIDWGKVRGFEPLQPFWRHCLLLIPAAIIPSLALVFAMLAVILSAGIDPETLHKTDEFKFTSAVIVGPIFETFVLTALLAILSRFVRSLLVVNIISAIAWGLAHAYHDPFHFVGPAWGFFVFSYAYLTWRKVSYWRGWLAALIPHSCNNLIVAGMSTITMWYGTLPV